MKRLLKYLLVFTFYLFASCAKESSKPTVMAAPEEEKQMEFLPFTNINLDDLSAFKKRGDNWQIVGRVIADRTEEKPLVISKGSGVLLNKNDKPKNENIFTAFEHGDIEIELDVMMPVKSNSGIYFQSRYEIQLFDSWGVEQPKYSDMGGVYERWDDTKEKGNEGYEGHAPVMNAAKAPGLWQHFKIIFHAPRFDETGRKIKNAWFEEVWLNGVLIQENVEVTGPTRGAVHNDEKPRGALMIQGDHGAVAIRNLKYKLYEDKKLVFSNLTLKEYETDGVKVISSMDSLKLVSEAKVESIDLLEIAQSDNQKIMSYNGMVEASNAGDYLFEMLINGGGILIIDNDTIIDMNDAYNMNHKGLGQVKLEKGATPFTLIYNKYHPRRRGFHIYVQGPEIQRYSIQDEPIRKASKNNSDNILIEVENEVVTQRSFLMHEDTKRTHCISVGSPLGIHYAYDLAGCALLKVWNGSFMDATQMWHSRGEHQMGEPRGFYMSSHGDLEFFNLENEKAIWPSIVDESINFKQIGYELTESGIPIFSSQIDNTVITNTFIPSSTERRLERNITIDGDKAIWHKIADGENIEVHTNNTYVINNESYYIELSEKSPKPIIRKINDKEELIMKIPSGKHNIDYSIIW